MDATGHESPERDLAYAVAGCAMAVLNELGHGLREKTYARALCLEFDTRSIPWTAQKEFPVFYRNQRIDTYVPDLLVDDRLVVETKVADSIHPDHVGQILNYLRIAKLHAGIILNFRHPKLEWQKVVL